MDYEWEISTGSIDQALNTEIPIVMVGDLNCNTLSKPNKLEEVCQSLGLRIINTEPTHVTEFSASCIDVAMTLVPTKISSIYTTSPTVSNHCGLIVTLDSPPPKANSYKRKILMYHKTDWKKVNQDIEKERWPENDDSLEELTFNWTSRCQEIVESNTPTKIIKIEPWSKVWYNREVKQARKERDKETRRMKRCRLPRTHAIWNKLKRLRENVKEKIKSAKEKRLTKLADRVNKGDTSEKTWWKLTKELYNKKVDTTSAPLVIDGIPISDLEFKANKFNKHFVDISSIPGMDDPIPEATEYDEDKLKLEKIPFTKEEVCKAMKSLKINSAPGPDLITNQALAKTSETMSEYLCYLFNRSVSEGLMPEH